MQPAPPYPAPAHWWQTRASGLLLHWKLRLVTYFVGFFSLSPGYVAHTHTYTHILLIQEKSEVTEVITAQERAR